MTDLQPCSPCREGNHDTCEATGNPYCGCRKADHNGALAGPVVAPIGEVLAAGQRAPQPEMAQLPATPEAPPVAPAATAADLLGVPAAPSLVDQVMGQLGAVLGVPPAVMGERTIEVGELEPDDIETDDLTPETVPDRGQAGLPDQPGPVTSAPTAPAASEGAPPAPSEAPPTYDSIPMVAERDPALYASVWDSHQAHFAEELPAVGYEHTPSGEAAKVAADATVAGLAKLVDNPTQFIQPPAEHAYAGTPEAPYACICGANPGTLNKLGSHLGITSDVDAMAELAKATVPNQLAASATVPETPVPAEGQPDDTAGLALDGSQANVPDIQGLPERASTIIGLVTANGCLAEVHQEGWFTTVTFTRDDRTAVADTLLEHFGFAPSPLDAEHPPVPPRTPPPPAPISGTGMAGLPGPDTTRPTRVQVARIATECAACHQTIEPGETIGYFPGTGWRHLTHA